MSQIEELRKEADDLGISYSKNLGEDKLKERIDEFYKSQETSGPALQEAVADKEAKADAKAKEQEEKMSAKDRKKIERRNKAMATKVVTIIDNDQRVNNQTTTCTVNCSNEFFDLGTVILPLNEKIEVAVGHLRTLEQVKIPLHVRDNKSGLSTVRMRPRYTISYEDIKTS